MTAIIDGSSLGLINSSLHTLHFAPGDALTGRSGKGVYVNAATGNLFLPRQDELLFGRGPDMAALRTDNSQGQTDGDNNDNWRIGFYRQLTSLTGTLNIAGNTMNGIDADGAASVFSYDSGHGKYVCRKGGGAFDTPAWGSASNLWRWVDGASGVSEFYRSNAVNGPCRLTCCPAHRRRRAAGSGHRRYSG